MNLQTRRINGSSFSEEDKLEVTFNSEGQTMLLVAHTIELVSGVNVTHGGGAQPNTYLHYKAFDRDADAGGVIDYSSIEMALIQEEKGTSVIRVKAYYVTQQLMDDHNTAHEAWENEPESAEKAEFGPIFSYPEVTTGEVTLDWIEDNFV